MISAQNAQRYLPLVRFAETVDTHRAVAIYERLYPLFQQAFEDLGYTNKYFNDRVVEVIDTLPAMPDVPDPIPVKMITVDDSPTPAGTAPLYVFADPALEHSLAGQKIMLRVGHENAVRLKAKLVEIRNQLIGATARVAPAAGDRR